VVKGALEETPPMEGSVTNLRPRRPRLIAAAAGAYALTVGVLTLLGYLLDVRRLTDWIDGGISMFPNAAACAVLGGVVLLLLTAADDRKPWRTVVRVTAGIVGLVGGLTLVEHLAGVNFGIDTLLFERDWGQRAAMAPMRMGPPASMSYLISGTGLLLATYGTRGRRIAAALGIVVVAIASLSLIGYWFGADQLFGVARFTGIALQTSSALAALGTGLIAAVPETGLAAILRRDDPGGVIVRRLVLPTIATPLALGWLRVTGQEAGYFDTAFGTALLALSMILLFVALLWWTAEGVSRQAQLIRAAEEDVRASEARYRSLFEVAVYGVLTIDERGIIESANPAAERLFGYSSSEMIGRNVSTLMPEPYKGEHDSYLQNYLRTGVRKIIGIGREVVGRRKDGSTFPMDLAVSESQLDGKRRFTGLVHDISERRWAEKERAELLASERAAREQAETANRAKDEFLATISHELRTPLNSIVGWAELLRKGALDEATLARAVDTISRNARSQAQLIEDLLDVSRIISGKMRLDVRRVDLAPIVEAAIDAVRPAADAKEVRIETTLNPRVGFLAGDSERLQQIAWNLLSNAVKFTPKGGRVQVSLMRVNSHVELTVADSGEGIAPELLPHVFDRFQQADTTPARRSGGLGLGLAIVRHLAEMHGGSVRVTSEGPGKGSVFTVTLPVVAVASAHDPGDATHPAVDVRHLAALPPSLAGVRVLVVDDDRDARDLLAVVLAEREAEVRTASSAAEGLAELRGWRPDVLVSDIGMPVEDGYVFIARVRDLPAEQGGNVPAVALTAYARAEDRLRVLEAGYQMHLPKPVEPSELVTVLASLTGRIGPKLKGEGA
jgi:PAS domain S-box-containing protein